MNFIQKFYQIRDQYIFHGSTQKLPPLQRFFVRSLRLVYAVLSDMTQGQLSLRAMSLVYTTFISMVPLLALSFSVLKGFGVHNQIKPLLENIFQPLGDQGVEITNNIIRFVDNIEVGVLGAVGLGLLIYSVIALMQKIEISFNHIWHVDRNRNLAQRFSDYLSALLIGPLFIFLSAGLTTSLKRFDLIGDLGLSAAMDFILNLFSIFIPFIIMSLAFTAIFIFMPNTRVKIFPAFIGGLFAAFMWKVMGFIFATLIASSTNYVAIYAAFATLILFMIWVYLAWLVVLIGSSIAFYVQYPRYIHIGYASKSLSIRMKETLALSIFYLIGKDFYEDKQQWDIISLSNELNVPSTHVSDIIDILRESGLIAKTSDDALTYIPAKPLDKITPKSILDTLRQFEEKGILSFDRLTVPPAIKQLLKDKEKAEKESLQKKKIKNYIDV